MIALFMMAAVVVAVLCWFLSGLVLRVGGILVALAGLSVCILGFVRPGPITLITAVAGALVAGVGWAMWLAGHWLYAHRHRYFLSRRAKNLLRRISVSLDPTIDWGFPVVTQTRSSPARGV